MATCFGLSLGHLQVNVHKQEVQSVRTVYCGIEYHLQGVQCALCTVGSNITYRVCSAHCVLWDPISLTGCAVRTVYCGIQYHLTGCAVRTVYCGIQYHLQGVQCALCTVGSNIT